MTSFNLKEKRNTGFTLLELLIVISIIAILSIALVFMLNPAETLKKARDAQRISDLKTVKTALGIMLTASSTPSLDNFAVNGLGCLTNTTWGGVTTNNTAAKIYYSYDGTVTPAGAAPAAGGDSVGGTAVFGPSGTWTRTGTSGAVGKVDGTGWIPVSLKGLTGGTPISSFPIDPVNSVTNPLAAGDLVYRYACQNGSAVAGKPSYIFEIDAVLESSAYTVDDNKMAKDGGDLAVMYEQGNTLNLLPATTTVPF